MVLVDKIYCKYCDVEKEASEFSGKNRRCKECVRQYMKQHYIKNKELIKEKQSEYYQNNKDKIEKYRFDNKEKISKVKQEYRIANKEKLAVYDSNRKRNKTSALKLRNNVSKQIRFSLKGNKSGRSCFKYLGYSLSDLKTHIESLFEDWMSWDNYGKYELNSWNDDDKTTWKWNLDHIIPHSTFNYISMEDEAFKQCWALDNLRPYSAKQNVLDGCRIKSY